MKFHKMISFTTYHTPLYAKVKNLVNANKFSKPSDKWNFTKDKYYNKSHTIIMPKSIKYSESQYNAIDAIPH